MYTRKNYLADQCTFDEYYDQFVSEKTKREVLQHINLTDVLNSKDIHLNDIPMKKWNGISGFRFSGGKLVTRPMIRHDLVKKIRSFGDTITPSVMVCIYKQSARQLQKDHTKANT